MPKRDKIREYEEWVEYLDRCFPLSILPPRVIVHDIFSYHEVILGGSHERIGVIRFLDNDLFGRFSRDQMNNIWFLFRSVKIMSKMSFVRKFVYFDLNRIEHLDIQTLELDSIAKNVSRHSKFMRNLNSLSFLITNKLTFEFTIFPDEDSFPNLKSLTLIRSERNNLDIFRSEEVFNDSFWTKLERDYLGSVNTKNRRNVDYLFQKDMVLTKITKLELFQIQLSHEVIIELPKLKVLVLIQTVNIKIVTRECLRTLVVANIPPGVTKEILMMSRFLVHLRIFASKDDNNHSFILNRSIFNPFDTLDKLLLYQCSFCDDDHETSYDLNLGSKIRSLCLIECYDFNGTRIYPFAPSVCHFRCILRSSGLVDDLRIFHVRSRCFWRRRQRIEHTALFDSIFENNEWSSLTHLEVNISGCGDDIKWNVPFDNLKLLSLSSNDLDDRIFQEHSFDVLDKLTLLYSSRIIGQRWKVMRNLTELNLMDMDGLSDSLFSENEFKNLCVLRLKNCSNESFVGKDWKPMNSLEKFEMRNCSRISDGLFQCCDHKNQEKEMNDSRFPKLMFLRIKMNGSMMKLKGVNWVYLSDLAIFRYGFRKRCFVRKFWENPPFSCEIKYSRL